MRLTKPPEKMTFDDLTPREKEISRLLAQGLRAGQVAAELNLALDTVTNHMRFIADKVILHNGEGKRRVRLGIALWAIRHDPEGEMYKSAASMAEAQ